MSTHDEKDLLTRELRERSADVGGHPIGMDAVRRSARRIQRRRQVVTGAVAAAVLAVAVPTALTVADINSTAPGPVAPGPSPTRTVEPRLRGPVAMTLEGLERGDDAHVDYLDRDQLVLADGGTVQLAKEYQEIARHGDGWVALSQKDGEFTRDLLDARGTVTSSAPSTYGLAVNRDGSHVAYSEVVNGRQRLLDASARDTRSVPAPTGGQVAPVGYAGPGVLVYRTEGETGQVFVLDEKSGTYEIDANPKLVSASAASEAEGFVAGMIESKPDGSCWAVVSYRTGNQTFNTCKHSLGRFSPNGKYVIGTDAYADGAGARSLAVLDAHNGKVLVQFERKGDSQLYLGEMVWEDNEHVLAPVVDGLKSQIVRFGVDGSMEAASEPATLDDYELPSPLRLSTQP
jgi:hypothetical protein